MLKITPTPTSTITPVPSPYSSHYSNENPILSKSSLNNSNQTFNTTNNGLNGHQTNLFNSAAAAFALYGSMLPSNFIFPSNDNLHGQTTQRTNFNLLSSPSSQAPNKNFCHDSSMTSLDQGRFGKNGQPIFSAFSAHPASSNFIQKYVIFSD
jgi:hypothetical protein